MADYKSMYAVLFNDVTTAIELLQQAQQKTEEIYISGEDTPLTIVGQPENDDGDHT